MAFGQLNKRCKDGSRRFYEDEIRSVEGLGVQFLSPSQTSSVFLRRISRTALKGTDALVITGPKQNELGFGTELAKAVPSFRVVGTPVVRPVRKAKGLSETAWLQ